MRAGDNGNPDVRQILAYKIFASSLLNRTQFPPYAVKVRCFSDPTQSRIVLSLVRKQNCHIYQEDWQGMSLRTLALALEGLYAARKKMALGWQLRGRKRRFN